MALKKKKIPRFHRQRAHFFPRIGKSGWRVPRGEDSLQRAKKKSRGAWPTVGYKQAQKVRGLHPSGLRESRVFNEHGLDSLDPKQYAVRIAAGVGKKKKTKIVEEAKKKGLRILNG